jgi:hypothetical protein
MLRPRTLAIVAGAAIVAVAVMRHGRRAAQGHRVPGGILIGDASVYDIMSRLVLGPLYRRIAADVAAVAPTAYRSSRSVADRAICRFGWLASTPSTSPGSTWTRP